MILYVIENSITPRIYVGVTARALCKRWSEHLKDARNGVDRALKTGRKLPPRSAEHSARISAGLVRAHARKRS